MKPADAPYGFRLAGAVHGTRRLVMAAAAFTAHCRADPAADPAAECYLSVFRYGPDFRTHLATRGSPKGYAGPCWSPWLWLDVDRPDLTAAADAARRLVGFSLDRFRRLDEDMVLVFFTGKKGYHVGLPLGFQPAPVIEFPAICRELATGLAAAAGTPVDPGVYQAVQPLRAPNSWHPATGRHKRRLTVPELMRLPATRHADMAAEPVGFDPPDPAFDPTLEADWAEAVGRMAARQHHWEGSAPGGGRLQRATLDFIRDGAAEGERVSRLFRAAADLAEHGGPHRLVELLLTEAALDTGLPPAEVRRVIGCGVAHTGARTAGKGGAP